MTVRRLRTAALLAAAALPMLACEFRPSTPELHYSLNWPAVEKNPDLAGDPAAQTQLQGALEMMFGTPANPRFLVLSAWRGEEFDPNDWGYAQVQADGEAWEALKAGNRRAYRAQIEAIQAGRFDDVEEPRHTEDLWRWWQDLRAEKGADTAALQQDGVALFEEYYPTLATSAAFYRNQCYHCHGAEGGGNGSTSAFLEPRPRDYRRGIFKFTALKGKARPRHEDLFRVLAEGIYTTAMPSFRRFTDAQLHGLVDYVRLLAIRGETEILLEDFYSSDEGFSLDFVQENYELVMARWREAPGQLITYAGEIPESTPERVAHGRALFMTPGEKGGANCVSCHGESGRGDGPSLSDPTKAVDDWGNPIRPRDFTRGLFRFGRRPIDLYRRIYAGINGTPMPEHFGMTITENGQPRTMTEDDIWDLVLFVRAFSSQSAEVASAGGPRGEGGAQ